MVGGAKWYVFGGNRIVALRVYMRIGAKMVGFRWNSYGFLPPETKRANQRTKCLWV